MRRIIATGVAGLIVAVGGGTPAMAEGSDYADHVRMCQQEMGFTGTHNPGVMHEGYSGWDPEHQC